MVTHREFFNSRWTNIGYTETPDSFIPFRPDVIGTPHKKSVSELSSFGIKESDIIAVIRNPELRHHPLTSLYHLCNEMRIRLESEQKHTLSTASPLDFKLETGLLGSLHIGDSTDYSTQQTGKKAALKAASSKVALAFKKFFQNGLKPLPHRKYKSKYNAAVQSAQVLPTSEYRVRTELARKPVPTILDSDRGSYIQSQTHQQSGGVRQGDFQTFTLNATSFSSTSPPPSVPTSGGYVYQTLERKPVPIGANQFNQTLSPPPTPGQSPNVPLQQQSSRPSFPLRHKKQSRSDGYEFIKKQMMNQALVL